MKKQIVIAQYKENVKWAYAYDIPVLIYTKDRHVKNVGRESYTYLQHIINNYDKLADYTFFLQGNPFEHVDKKMLEKYINQKRMPNKMILLGKQAGSCGINGSPQKCLHVKEFEKEMIKILFDLQWDYKEFYFTFGANFIVPKNKILQRPKSFYVNLCKFVDKEIDPISGHCLERLWVDVFSSRDNFIDCKDGVSK
jgi:hypothetical protein